MQQTPSSIVKSLAIGAAVFILPAAWAESSAATTVRVIEGPQSGLYRMGQYLQREDPKRLALVMFRSMGQLIDPYGSQGEQIDHTNFAMTGEKDLFRLRGTYSEGHTPFWITTHFLTAAAEFERMGVDLDE